jgi:hypothetical protein
VTDRERSTFPHRKNEDGTVDSICPMCFRTVASCVAEWQLAKSEREHICEGHLTGSQARGRSEVGMDDPK